MTGSRGSDRSRPPGSRDGAGIDTDARRVMALGRDGAQLELADYRITWPTEAVDAAS